MTHNLGDITLESDGIYSIYYYLNISSQNTGEWALYLGENEVTTIGSSRYYNPTQTFYGHAIVALEAGILSLRLFDSPGGSSINLGGVSENPFVNASILILRVS
jgi:hypothetical protein